MTLPHPPSHTYAYIPSTRCIDTTHEHTRVIIKYIKDGDHTAATRVSSGPEEPREAPRGTGCGHADAAVTPCDDDAARGAREPVR